MNKFNQFAKREAFWRRIKDAIKYIFAVFIPIPVVVCIMGYAVLGFLFMAAPLLGCKIWGWDYVGLSWLWCGFSFWIVCKITDSLL